MRYKFKKHPSRLATLMVAFGAGSRIEFGRDYPAGMAHFMEHMRFKGTEKLTAKEILKMIAHAGGSSNAWTSEDTAGYHVTIPEENIEVAFRVMADVVKNPTFPKEEMEKEREVVCQEIRMYDDEISENAHNETMLWAFSNSLASPILGFESSVRSVTQNDLIRFNKEFYNNEQMLIVLAAQNDYSHWVEKYFGIPDDSLVFPAPAPDVKYGNSIAGEIRKEGQLQNHISISFGSEKLHKLTSDPVLRGVRKVTNTIFGGNDDSRLFLRIREDLGLVYGINSCFADYMDGTLFTIVTDTEPGKSKQVIDSIEEEIDKMCKSKPTEEELQRAKNRIKSHVYSVLDSSIGTADITVLEEFYGLRFDSQYFAQIDAVTADEVHQFAQSIFDGNKYVAIGMGTE